MHDINIWLDLDQLRSKKTFSLPSITLANLAPGSICRAPPPISLLAKLSRNVKEQTAPPNVKVATVVASTAMILDAWIRTGVIFPR
jgi:hypothetical protein